MTEPLQAMPCHYTLIPLAQNQDQAIEGDCCATRGGHTHTHIQYTHTHAHTFTLAHAHTHTLPHINIQTPAQKGFQKTKHVPT